MGNKKQLCCVHSEICTLSSAKESTEVSITPSSVPVDALLTLLIERFLRGYSSGETSDCLCTVFLALDNSIFSNNVLILYNFPST